MSRRNWGPPKALPTTAVAGALFVALLAPTAVVAGGGQMDRDGDGLRNRYERVRTHTNPRVKDSDRDGVRDSRENPDRDGPTNRQEQWLRLEPRDKDSDDDGVRDGREDPDHDGLTNRQEFKVGTRPRTADSDHDGIDDGDEDDEACSVDD